MVGQRENWSSRLGFILAASGSAIGLGNLWKFPYITWANEGGAFVYVYLICIAIVGMPIMIAEILIGRKTQKSPVGALREVFGRRWSWVGGLGVLTGFILLSYYLIIAGWTLHYFIKCVGWTLNGFTSGSDLGQAFGGFLTGIAAPHNLAAAQHRCVITKGANFFQLVRDIEDRRALLAQLLERRE